MLSLYGTEKDCLVEHPKVLDQAVISKAVWIDLVDPSHDEEQAVEAALGIDIPTRGELEEIEASSRLYQEVGGHEGRAIFLIQTA